MHRVSNACRLTSSLRAILIACTSEEGQAATSNLARLARLYEGECAEMNKSWSCENNRGFDQNNSKNNVVKGEKAEQKNESGTENLETLAKHLGQTRSFKWDAAPFE